MAAAALRSEERIGLAVAVVVHAAIVAVLLVRPPAMPVTSPPERMEVTISTEIAPTSTSPEPMAQAAPDIAPAIGEPAPPEPAPEKIEAPQPQAQPPASRPQASREPPKPAPRPVAKPRPAPKPVPRPAPKPAARPEPRPSPRPAPSPAVRPEVPRPAAKAAAKAAPARPTARSSPAPARNAGGSRIGDDFLKGVPGARDAGQARTPPAQAAGPAVQSSLIAAISRALRPHLQGKLPEGADAEKLVTVLRWNLNRDGSLDGPVEFIRQEGRTDANQPQWDRHREAAIRAVQLAAPFDLPEQYYDAWKRVGPIRFDKRLSQ